ncbi:hypothetical protein ACIBQ1_59635 [Nonomuraea sp. NPDC050153]|uniref:hypothetical protein n=1 Tax=Nonomuraea sp. NPDC050153 TaxID=3364359 RepID=UPI0037B5A612
MESQNCRKPVWWLSGVAWLTFLIACLGEERVRRAPHPWARAGEASEAPYETLAGLDRPETEVAVLLLFVP